MSHTIPTFIKEEAGPIPGQRVVSAWCNGAVVYSKSCTLLELDYHQASATKACEAVIRSAQASAKQPVSAFRPEMPRFPASA